MGLQLRTANQQALLHHCDFTLWENIMKFKDRLLEDSRQEFSVMVEEGKLVARTVWMRWTKQLDLRHLPYL